MSLQAYTKDNFELYRALNTGADLGGFGWFDPTSGEHNKLKRRIRKYRFIL